MIFNKLQNFYINMKLNEKRLIYQFYINLNNKYLRHCEKYSQKHDFFDNNENIKYIPNSNI